MSATRPGTTVAASTKAAGRSCATALCAPNAAIRATESFRNSMRVGMYFDSDMRQAGETGEPLLVDCRRLWRRRNYRNHHRKVSRSDLPKVQIANPVAIKLHESADVPFKVGIRNGIEQHAAGGAQQSKRPACDHE